MTDEQLIEFQKLLYALEAKFDNYQRSEGDPTGLGMTYDDAKFHIRSLNRIIKSL